MSTANVQVMIDHLLERYGFKTTDTVARARCLKWLQSSEEEVWSKGPWWFKQGRLDVPIVGGTRTYSVNVNNSRVDTLEQGDGGILTRVHPEDFRHLIGSDATGGAPRLWCVLEPSSTGYPQIQLWPTPTAPATLKAVYRRSTVALADSDASVSQVPPDWRYVVLLRAEVYSAVHQGQAGQAQVFMAEYESALDALRAANDSIAQVTR